VSKWRDNSLALIRKVHEEVGLDCSLIELKRALRPRAWEAHGYTSWGKKMWSSARQRYFQEHFGHEPAVKQKRVEDSPLFSAADHTFPFREQG
jgi:hypothetical protein